MLRGLNGLTATVVSFCGVLQPAELPAAPIASPLMVSTFAPNAWYGVGCPMKLWHRADTVGSSPLSSPPSANCSFNSGLGTLCLGNACVLACRTRPPDGSIGAGRDIEPGDDACGVTAAPAWPDVAIARTERSATANPVAPIRCRNTG